mgnify:CR=1 FL=1
MRRLYNDVTFIDEFLTEDFAIQHKLFSFDWSNRTWNQRAGVEDFAGTLMEELDFRKEAANLDRFNDIMRELGHKHIHAPVPHHEYTTRKVLVMERFSGIRVG